MSTDDVRRTRLASWGERALAAVLDAMLHGLVVVFLVLLGRVIVPWGPAECAGIEGGTYPCSLPTTTGDAIIVALVVIGALFPVVYECWCVGRTGRTVGRRTVGIVVLDRRSGAPIGIGPAVLRCVLKFAFVVPCGLPLLVDTLWPLWDDEHRTLRDRMVGSVVVRDEPPPVPRSSATTEEER